MDRSDQRMDGVEQRLGHLEEKVDAIFEQVQLGKHLILFAKMMGWVIGTIAAFVEAYRAFKGQ